MSRVRLLSCLSRLMFGVLALVSLVVVAVTFTPLDAWWANELAGGWNDPPGDVLIVLGGAQDSTDGIIAWDSYVRSVYAVREYRKQKFPLIVLSGGGAPISVASAMSSFLQAQGIPATVLRLEEQSRSTRENAQFTAQLLSSVPGRKVLLTSDYHVYRALRAFHKVGVEASPRPIPDVVKRAGAVRGRWPAFLDLIEEDLKIGYYWVRGWI